MTTFQRNTIFLGLILVVLVYTPASIFSKTGAILPRVLWEQKFHDLKLDYEYQSMHVTREGEAWVALGPPRLSQPSNNLTRKKSFRLWRVNKDGRKVQDIGITLHSARETYSRIDYLTITEENDFLAVTDGMYTPSLLKVDKMGKVVFVKRLENPHIQVTKMIPAPNQEVFLIGSNSGGAIVMKFNTSGDLLWEETYSEKEKMIYLLDGFSLEDGEAVFIGISRSSEQLKQYSIGTGAAEVLVIKTNSRGRIQARTSFPGRYPRGTKDNNRTYAVVYDKGDSAAQDIRIRFLDSTLQKSWEVSLITISAGMSQFHISFVDDRGYMVIGDKNFRLWAAYTDSIGNILWKTWDDSLMSLKFDLTSYQDGFLISAPRYIGKTETGLPQNGFGLVKFTFP